MSIPPSLTQAFRHYAFGLLSTMWNAGWNGLAGILGIDGAALTGVSDKLHILTAHEMAAGYVGAAVIHGILWIKAHPLPETYETNPPTPPPKP